MKREAKRKRGMGVPVRPRLCIQCRELAGDGDVMYCVEQEDGRHIVTTVGPFKGSYDHEALAIAALMVDSALQWMNQEEGERMWLATLTFAQTRKSDGSIGPPGRQYGREKLREYVKAGAQYVSSLMATEEFGSWADRLHYHVIMAVKHKVRVRTLGDNVVEKTVGTRLLRSLWRYGYPDVKLAQNRQEAVAYALKYPYKDFFTPLADGGIPMEPLLARHGQEALYMPAWSKKIELAPRYVRRLDLPFEDEEGRGTTALRWDNEGYRRVMMVPDVVRKGRNEIRKRMRADWKTAEKLVELGYSVEDGALSAVAQKALRRKFFKVRDELRER